MRRPLTALRIWLPTAALLCAGACEHGPDVVAKFEATPSAGTNAGSGTSAGAGASGSTAGTVGAPVSGSGGTFEVAGTNAHGDAGALDDGGTAGSQESPMKDCEPAQPYSTINAIVDADCKFNPVLYPAVARFVDEAPEMPMGESRLITICEAAGIPHLYADTDGNLVLCPSPCDAARKWLADQDCKVKLCLGLGACDAEDAGS